MTEEEKTKNETADSEEETEDSADDESAEEDTEESEESEDEEESQNTEKDEDYDAEIEAEKKRGKPDLAKAAEAARERRNKRKQDEASEESGEEDTEDDEDKPMTRREAREWMAQNAKTTQETQASTLARSMAGSDKEAELIVLKWKNRTFPEGMNLSEQIEEAYAITHRKKLIGERNELARALRNKDSVNRNAAGSHRDAIKGKEPQSSSQDTIALKRAGFKWNGSTKRLEKKLKNGDTIFQDPKTKKTGHIAKA